MGGESTSSIQDANAATTGGKTFGKSEKDSDAKGGHSTENVKEVALPQKPGCCMTLAFLPCALVHKCLHPGEDSSEQQLSEDGMFYCSLCEVEVCSEFICFLVKQKNRWILGLKV